MNERPAQIRQDKKRSRLDTLLIILSRVLFTLSMILVLIGLIAGGRININFTGQNPELISSIISISIVLSVVFVNGIVGLLIISRYPRHTVGWLLLILGLVESLLYFSSTFDYVFQQPLDTRHSPLVLLFAWIGQWIWLPLAIIPIIFVPLYFPDGRLVSKRWRFAAVAAVLGLFFGIISVAIHPGPFAMIGATGLNPFQISGAQPLAEFLWPYLTIPLLLIAVVGSIASFILRYRRAEGVERVQIRWVIYVGALGILLNVSFFLVFQFVPDDYMDRFNTFSNLAVLFLALMLPIAVGIAILRYRLYDIDIIIRKTLVYAMLTGLLALVYFGTVVLLQGIFETAAGEQSPIAIVISTLVIAALFAPLRRRIQEVIDRRFYRQKYDAQQVLAEFAQTARDETELDQLTAELLQVVQETMQPERVDIWLPKV